MLKVFPNCYFEKAIKFLLPISPLFLNLKFGTEFMHKISNLKLKKLFNKDYIKWSETYGNFIK